MSGGMRKDGKPFKQGNTRPDGSYEVGDRRAPPHGRFAVNDGRPRGRKPKGSKNFDTEFEEEGKRPVPVLENGKVRKVSKRRAAIIRLYDNGSAKGQNAAIEQIVNNSRRIDDRRLNRPDRELGREDQTLIDAWLMRRMSQLNSAAEEGDPDELPADSRGSWNSEQVIDDQGGGDE